MAECVTYEDHADKVIRLVLRDAPPLTAVNCAFRVAIETCNEAARTFRDTHAERVWRHRSETLEALWQRWLAATAYER